MTTLFNDTKYALRQLIKSPGFTAVAVLSLALGIGANTTIFSFLNAVLFRSLPVRNPHQLREISCAGNNVKTSFYSGGGAGSTRSGKHTFDSFPYPVYETFRDQASGFSDVFAFSQLHSLTAVTPFGAHTTGGMLVSGNFFSGYGASTLIGRPLTPEDDRPEANPVAVITYQAWQRYYGLDPDVLGRTVALNRNSFTIVGVLPRAYVAPALGDPVHFYLPMAAQSQLRPDFPLTSDIHWWLQIMARRSPGVKEAQAQASLAVLFDRFLQSSPDSMDQPEILMADASHGLLSQRRSMAGPLWAMQAAVGLVLLIACVNLAGLMLARGAARRHEMAVRAAIGAGRWRLIRQSLTESLVLSLGGAALGLVFAAWIKMAILGFLSGIGDNPGFDIRTDATVLAFTLATAFVVTFLFGLIPAWRAGRTNPSIGLQKAAGRAAPRLRLGKVLVAAQVGLSVLLVMAAGLFLQSLVNIYRVDTGFNIENLLVFRVNPAQAGYRDQELVGYYERVRQAIGDLPGVRSVSLSSLTLLRGSYASWAIEIDGRPSDQHLQSAQLVVNDGFFPDMGISLLSGREFTPSDRQGSAPVAVVNEAFSQSFFPDERCLGKTFRVGGTQYQIVGLCSDAKYNDVRRDVPPIMCFPYRQASPQRMTFAVRSILPAMSLVPAVRRLITNIDQNIPMEEVSTQKQVVKNAIMSERLFAGLCGTLAMLALALSCIGLYGLMAYSVARRTGELGIRMALGARPQDVARPVLREALVLAAIGVAVGMPAALLLTRLARSVFFGIEPHDPATIFGSIITLLAVALLAAWIPARRAAKTDPIEALRYE